MTEFNEAIYLERERELVRRVGSAEAAAMVAREAQLRAELALEAIRLESKDHEQRANHYQSAFHKMQESGFAYESHMKKLASAIRQIRSGIKVLEGEKLTALLDSADGMPDGAWYEQF